MTLTEVPDAAVSHMWQKLTKCSTLGPHCGWPVELWNIPVKLGSDMQKLRGHESADNATKDKMWEMCKPEL